METTKNILSLISRLSFDDKRQLINLLTNELFLNNLDKYRTENTGDRPTCPKCGGNHIIKNGSQNNVQKFRCKKCFKTFGLHTGTSVYWLHSTSKEDWTKFISLTLESKSIRSICKDLGHSKQTVFNWRHKLLTSLDKVFTKQFKGVVEMDDMYVRFNQKGRKSNFVPRLSQRGVSSQQVSVLFTLDRYKTIDLQVLRKGKVDMNSISRILDNGLVDRLNKENIIVTDYCRSYSPVLNGLGFSHEKLNMSKGEKVRGQFHLNTLNNQCGEFKRWISYHFRSVSTKYLQNYLNCFKLLFFVLKDKTNEVIEFLKLSLKDGSTFKRFHSTEERYQGFLSY